MDKDHLVELISDSLVCEHSSSDSSQNINDFKNKTYLSIARNFRRYGWIYLLLYGASPLASGSFAANRPNDLQSLSTGDLYKPYATSLRMGDLGYISHAQDSLNISFNSLDAYCLDLKNALLLPITKKTQTLATIL